jgi:hypothetical protein
MYTSTTRLNNIVFCYKMQTNRKYRIFKNLSYIPRKPHGFYYKPETGGTIKMEYNKDPRKSYTRNIIDPSISYKKHHDRITALTKKANGILSKNDAIHIWSFVKIMTRNILDRTHELLFSSNSYIINHEQILITALNANQVISMESFNKFKKKVKGHLTLIEEQTTFLLKHIGYYKNTILYIMKLRIQNRKTFLKISKFVRQYFNNIRSIMNNIHKNISSLMTNTNNYVTSVSNYNQKYYRIRRGSRIPSEHTKLKDKRFVMNAFNKMKNTNDRDFQVLLQMIKLSERQENSKNMELYKQIISRSNQKLP